MRVPASLVAVPLVAGCAAGLNVVELHHIPLCAAGAAILALLAGLAAFAERNVHGCTVCVLAGSCVAGLSLGASSAKSAYAPSLLRWFHAGATPTEPVVLAGRLREDASFGAVGVSLALDVEAVSIAGGTTPRDLPVGGGVRLSIGGALASLRIGEWRAGRLLRVTATLREPAVYLNPGVPDDRRSLARRGIVLVGSVKSGALVEVVAPGSRIEEAAAASRAWVRTRLANAVGRWSRRSGGVATAILIGDRTGLDEEDERRLQEAGTYHVIAISGGNIAILTALLLTAFRVLHVPAQIAAGTSIVILLCYGAIAAPAASVSRAITAAIIYLAGRLLDQRGSMLNVLAVAAIIAPGASPVAVFDPGFILSFGATLGILVGVGRLDVVTHMVRRASRAAAGVLAATIAAEIALAPFGALFFWRVTFAGLVLNFAAIPLMTVVQSGSLALLALTPWYEPAALHCGYIVHLAATGLVESARLVEIAPWLARDVLPPAWWVIALYYVSLTAALVFQCGGRLAISIAMFAAICIVAGAGPSSRSGLPPVEQGSLRIAFLDVGQGDATALLLPDGRTMLVDAGGFPIPALQDAESGHRNRFDIGQRVVVPALRALGVRRLDPFVLTHGDPDHIGGAPAVLRQFRPRALWEGVPVPPHPELKELTTIADRLDSEWRTVQAGDRLRIGQVHVTVLHPPPPEWERQRVRNEDSVVLHVRFGDVAIVLPGDIGREGEAALLKGIPASPIVILKAAHHGSATSTTPAFLSAVRPAAVIFSAGRANRFGHPARPVVSRVRESGAAIFSTATDGAVILDTDGQTVHIRGWTGRSLTITRERSDAQTADRAGLSSRGSRFAARKNGSSRMSLRWRLRVGRSTSLWPIGWAPGPCRRLWRISASAVQWPLRAVLQQSRSRSSRSPRFDTPARAAVCAAPVCVAPSMAGTRFATFAGRRHSDRVDLSAA